MQRIYGNTPRETYNLRESVLKMISLSTVCDGDGEGNLNWGAQGEGSAHVNLKCAVPRREKP